MNEYIMQAVIRYYDDNGNINIKDVFGSYKNIAYTIPVKRVYSVTIFNDALNVIRDKFNGIPITFNTDSIQYHGDFAKFVVANIGEI